MDNIKMDLRERGWDCVDWIHMAQDRDQWWALEHGIEPSGSRKFWEVIIIITFPHKNYLLPY
jgi:hypothetical protein